MKRFTTLQQNDMLFTLENSLAYGLLLYLHIKVAICWERGI